MMICNDTALVLEGGGLPKLPYKNSKKRNDGKAGITYPNFGHSGQDSICVVEYLTIHPGIRAIRRN